MIAGAREGPGLSPRRRHVLARTELRLRDHVAGDVPPHAGAHEPAIAGPLSYCHDATLGPLFRLRPPRFSRIRCHRRPSRARSRAHAKCGGRPRQWDPGQQQPCHGTCSRKRFNDRRFLASRGLRTAQKCALAVRACTARPPRWSAPGSRQRVQDPNSGLWCSPSSFFSRRMIDFAGICGLS